MSKYSKFLVIAAALLTLSACDRADPARPAVIKGKAVAKVNNVEITRPELDSLMNARNMGGQPVPEEQALDELIGLELLRQEAVAKGVFDDPEIAAEVNRQVANIIVSRHVNDIFTSNPITDEDIAAEYNRQIEARPDKEYKSSHILVATEEEASAIIKQLDTGSNFAELAKQKSTGPSGKSGGSLGWSSPSDYVPEFALALQSIEPGKYSSKPVKTQFGWHVIKVEDIREANKPPIEQVKPQLQRMIMTQRITEYVDNLRNNAKVTIIEEKEPVAEQAAPAEETTEAEETASAEEAPATEAAPVEEPAIESEEPADTETE